MSFQPLTTKALGLVRPLLQSKLPESVMALNILDMTLKGKYPKGHHVDFFSFNGVPKNPDDLFLDIMLRPKYQPDPCSLLQPPYKPTTKMLEAFVEHHDWTVPQIYEAVTEPVAAQMVKVIVEKGGGLILYPTDIMYMPIEEALKIDVEAKYPVLKTEFDLDKLGPEHAEKVNYYWKYGFKGGEKMLSESLQTMGGMGIFKKASSNRPGLRSPENMVGWITLQHLGTLGALYTLDEYRGKRLARIVMEASSKWIAEQGLIPTVEVEDYNIASKKVMQAIGYKYVRDIFWIEYCPPLTG